MSSDQKELKLQSERNIFRILFVKIYLQGFQDRYWTAKVKFKVYNETLIIILKAGYKNCMSKNAEKLWNNLGNWIGNIGNKSNWKLNSYANKKYF